MFRRLPGCLPIDPVFPTNIEALGFNINHKHQLRRIVDSEKLFEYKVTNNERYNEKHKEAVYDCIRAEIHARLLDGGLLERVYLRKEPAPYRGANTTEASLPIYCSPKWMERKLDRVVVVVQDHYDDWLLWSRNTIKAESGIEAGSAIGLAKALKEQSGDVGLIVLNPCELLYSYDEHKAMSRRNWEIRTGRSFVHPPRKLTDWNEIDGHETPEKHIQSVFEDVIARNNPHMKIDLIGINGGCETILLFLNDNWNKYSDRISAVALTNCRFSLVEVTSKPFLAFLAQRGRAWKLSECPEGTVLKVPEPVSLNGAAVAGWSWERVLCPQFSAGELETEQDTFTQVYKKILAWFDEVSGDPEYCNPYFEPVEVEKKYNTSPQGEGEYAEQQWEQHDGW